MAAGSNAISLGIIDLIWGGVKLSVATGATFSPGGIVGKPVVAGRQVTEAGEFMPFKLSASFPLTAGMSLAALKALNGSEMQIKCDTGQTFTSPSAFLEGDISAKGGAGNNVSAKWAGQEAVELIS
jgi:hypothetical protein